MMGALVQIWRYMGDQAHFAVIGEPMAVEGQASGTGLDEFFKALLCKLI